MGDQNCQNFLSPSLDSGPTGLNLPSLSDILTDSLDNDDDNSVDECTYISPSEINSHLEADSFNVLSFNSRSLSASINDLQDLIADSEDRFSVIAVQEIWSAKKEMVLPGYKSLASITRDQDKMANPGCGGGIGFFFQQD